MICNLIHSSLSSATASSPLLFSTSSPICLSPPGPLYLSCHCSGPQNGNLCPDLLPSPDWEWGRPQPSSTLGPQHYPAQRLSVCSTLVTKRHFCARITVQTNKAATSKISKNLYSREPHVLVGKTGKKKVSVSNKNLYIERGGEGNGWRLCLLRGWAEGTAVQRP